MANDCEYYLDGKCGMVAMLTGINVAHCDTTPEACAACSACERPRDRNRVTASLAIAYAKQHMRPDEANEIKHELMQEITVEKAPAPTGGPGTELKKLLSRLGFATTRKCNCASHAREMDHRGVDWCRANVETIIQWLREEAEKQGLPFVSFAARMLILYAIRRASK